MTKQQDPPAETNAEADTDAGAALEDVAELDEDAQATQNAIEKMNKIHPALRDAGIYLLNSVVMNPLQTAFETAVNPRDTAPASLPTDKGVYVFLAPGHHFDYPGGSTSIMYIGKAESARGLRRRLSTHFQCINLLCEGENYGERFYPLYEWAATYNPLVTYCAVDDPDFTAKDVEYELLRVFCDAYRATPVANSQSAW